MELFIAVGLEPDTARTLTEYTAQALPAHPAEHPADLHITLHYLGEMADTNAVAERLTQVAIAPFSLEFTGLNFFLREDAPTNVIWQGVSDPEQGLPRLRDAVSEALGDSFPRKSTEFTPHITLSYTSAPFDGAALTAMTTPVTGQCWQVREFQLWQVLPGGQRPAFRKLAAYALSSDTVRRQARILCINDFHGVLLENATDLGAARLTTAVKRYCAAHPETAVVFGGDNCFGEPVSDLLNGTPVLDMMKALDAKATVLGNHDLDLSVEAVARWPEYSGASLLAANLAERSTGKLPNFVRPWQVLTVNGYRIALLGLCTVETLPGPDHPKSWGDYILQNAADTARTYAAQLAEEKRSGKLDALLGLTHLGLKEMAGGLLDGPEVLETVREAPMLDGMFTAHFHRFLQFCIDSMPVVQGGGRGQGFSVMLLTFGRDRKLLSVVPMAYDLQERHGEFPPDAAVTAKIDEAYRQVQPQLSQVIFTAAEDIHNRNMADFSLPITGTPLSKLATDVMLERTGCQVAMAYAGRIGGPGFRKGPVTLYDFYKAYSFSNILVTTEMTGREIAENINIGMRTLAQDGASPLAVGGLTVTMDPAQPYLHRVTDIRLPDGSPLEPEKHYSVVLEDYLASNPFGFRFPDGSALTYHNDNIRSAMLDYFRKHGTVYDEYPTNIHLERKR